MKLTNTVRCCAQIRIRGFGNATKYLKPVHLVAARSFEARGSIFRWATGSEQLRGRKPKVAGFVASSGDFWRIPG